MNKLVIAFVATISLFAISGCKKKGGGGAGEAMAKMSEFKDKMCACKDADCAKKVSDDMTAWSQKQAQNTKEPVKMSEADQKKATEIGTQMGECMQKAMGMGATGSDTAGSAMAGSDTGSAAPAAAGSDTGSAAPAAAGSDTGSAAPAAAGSAAAGSAEAGSAGSAATK